MSVSSQTASTTARPTRAGRDEFDESAANWRSNSALRQRLDCLGLREKQREQLLTRHHLQTRHLKIISGADHLTDTAHQPAEQLPNDP